MTQKRKLSDNSTGIKQDLEGKKQGESKRALKDFLASEEGFVSKETVLKVGLATVSGVSMLAGMAAAQTPTCGWKIGCGDIHCSHSNHTNSWAFPNNGVTDCPMYQPLHTNDTPHTSHCSY